MAYKPDDPELVPAMLELVKGLSVQDSLGFLFVVSIGILDPFWAHGNQGRLAEEKLSMRNQRGEKTLKIIAYWIGLKNEDSTEEKVMALGHEIGHILCEDILLGIKARLTDAEGYRKIEKICDTFASSWLSDPSIREEALVLVREVETLRVVHVITPKGMPLEHCAYIFEKRT